ncbi:tetratricopeptide repeat protein [Actomonas aquatica]|uniref:Tetratricopeptide repeat protein n=1 Tax=Actomonas aquatica TaxID=2866162 RepID=A0ABZ1C343_9BACT|nr:tetratricopeptide repeat protein [Opitutus sp. WL0086]WRQ86128.1 tetratricopeptide repeat protein [Opitutus sp. WL0086]
MSPKTPRRFLVTVSSLAGLALAWPALPLSAQSDGGPILLSTEGGGVSWTDVDEMIAAAKAGNPAARLHYAIMLEEGYPGKVDADPAQALTILRELAADGDHEALFRLGKIAHDGLLNQPQDYTKALDLYRRAAAAGNNTAMHNVGAMYVSGRGVKRDYTEGLAWLMLGAENGIGESSVDQVKHRLRKYPDRITKAEARLETLKAELGKLDPRGDVAASAPEPDRSFAPPVAPAPTKVTLPKPTIGGPTSPSLPSVSPTSPSIGVPTISLPPPPPPTPTPAPDPQANDDQN